MNKEKVDECNVKIAYNCKMLPEFQLWLAMTEISARNCLDDEWPLLISEVSRASPKKTISEEKLMIARLLNVVNVCGSSFIWILFFL